MAGFAGRVVIALIGFYQRRLSPRKGYRCAYGHHTGRASCSRLGYRAVRRFGAWRGLQLLRQRMYLCGVAHRRYHRVPAPAPGLAYQVGVIDLDCDTGDALDCCDSEGCDRSHKKRKPIFRNREKYIHIPPQK